MKQDKAALTARLFEGMDVEAIQLLIENQPDKSVDDTKVWTRWVINPGLSSSRSLGNDALITQYGTATLQVFVPKGKLTGPGDDVADAFARLFRGWRSLDGKLVIDNHKVQSSSYNKGAVEFHLINAMVFWHSIRRASTI